MISKLQGKILTKIAGMNISFLTLIFCLLRLALNLKSPDIISTPDELYQGYIATEWLRGLRANLFHYQGDPYTGGSLVVGTLAAPLFAILGKSLFALKCVPVFLSAAALFFLCRLLKQQFGNAAAVAAGLLMIFSPPGYTALSLMALGSHPESTLFAVVILCALWKYFQRPCAINAFLFGFSGGFACWFAQINVAMDLLCAAVFVYYTFRKRLPFSHITLKLLGAAAGFSPWLFYNATHHWAGAAFLLSSLSPSGPGGFISLPARLVSLLGSHFPASLFLQPFLLSAIFTVAVIFAHLLFIISSLKERIQNSLEKNIFLFVYLLFPGIFLLLFAYFQSAFSWHYQISPFRFRYFYPFFYFLAVSVSVLAFHYRRCRLVYYFILFCGVLGQIQLFASPSVLKGTDRPGYFLENPKRVLGTAAEAETDWTSFPSVSAALEYIKQQPLAAQPGQQRELGEALFHWDSVTARPEPLFRDFNAEDLRGSPWVLRGIGHSLLWTLESPAMLQLTLRYLPQTMNFREIYWGLGWRLREYEGDFRLISKYSAEAAAAINAGYGSYLE